VTTWDKDQEQPDDWGPCDKPPRRVWFGLVGFLATSRMYPVDVTDGLECSFRLPSHLDSYRNPVDPLAAAFRTPTAGDLRQTYFPHYENVNDIQFLSAGFRLPSVGNLGPTYFPHNVDVNENQHLIAEFRLPAVGTLVPGKLVTLEDTDNLSAQFRLPSGGDLS